MENTDQNWKWLDEHLVKLSATNSNSVTAGMMTHLHQTGRTPSALIAHLLRGIHQKNMELKKQKELSQDLTEAHEKEKAQLLKLMFSINQNANASSTSSSLETLSTPSPTGSSTSSAGSRLTVAEPKTRDKSPKRVLQYMVNNEVEKLDFMEPWYPSRIIFPNVCEFKAIIQKEEPFTGGYLCINCNTVLMSSLDKNNQRTFSNHLLKCVRFNEKSNGDDGATDGNDEMNGKDNEMNGNDDGVKNTNENSDGEINNVEEESGN